MTTPNAELAYKVLDHIDAHPEQWDQGIYIGKAECGTAACFAGWAVLLSGAEPIFPGRPLGSKRTDMVKFDDRIWTVEGFAEHLLGASRYVGGTDEELDLFCGSNSREDLGELVAEIFGPRPHDVGVVVDACRRCVEDESDASHLGGAE